MTWDEIRSRSEVDRGGIVTYCYDCWVHFKLHEADRDEALKALLTMRPLGQK